MTTRLSSLKDGRAKLVTNVGGGEEDRDRNMRAYSSSSQVEGEPTPNGEVEEGEGEEGYSEPIVIKTLRSASLDATIHISNFHGLEQDEYQIRKYSLPVSLIFSLCVCKNFRFFSSSSLYIVIFLFLFISPPPPPPPPPP